MLYLALGAGALALYFWITGGRIVVLKRREWRLLSGAAALAAFTAAAFLATRGDWPVAIVLAVLGLWMAGTTRTWRSPAPPPTSRMSAAEARRILGVEEGATRAEIQAAYARLMRAVHPDKGGTAGLAAQLNAARDALLK
jgi:hypothetical protein